jgi:hypothetical protein
MNGLQSEGLEHKAIAGWCFLRCSDAVWLFARIDVSEEYITSIFRMTGSRFILVRSEDVPHDGPGRKPLATALEGLQIYLP